MEFHKYFSIYCKTRYLIHLTTCNEHILTTSDQNRNLIAYIMDKCVNTVSLHLCLEYCQSCQSCQFDQLVALYFETNTFNLKI